LSAKLDPDVEDAMGAIMIRCPTTQQLVPVGIDTDKESFDSLPNVPANPVVCPLCGKSHPWRGRMQFSTLRVGPLRAVARSAPSDGQNL
jgi:hypothetical protein